MHRQEHLKRIKEYFGTQKQLMKIVEECGELISAFAMWSLDICDEGKVLEESADVIVIMSQFTDEADCLQHTVQMDHVIDMLTVTLRSALKGNEKLINDIQMTIGLVRKFIDQLGLTKQLEEEINYKINRTIKYIDSGKYKN